MSSCIVCGFDKVVHLHHIIKKRELGSDKDDNLVYLCPNHHWLADFGDEKDRLEMLAIIKELTSKVGSKISNTEENILDLKVRHLQAEVWKDLVWDQAWWASFKETSNYFTCRSFLIGRGCPDACTKEMNDKAEKLMLITKIKETMNYRWA